MNRNKIVDISLIVIGVAIITIVWVGLVRLNSLSNHIVLIEHDLASTTAELRKNITSSHTALSEQLSQEKTNVGNIEQKLGAYKQEVGSFSSTVTTLQKLSKTDPELLEKYSKVFFLNENYAPARLTEVPNQYSYSDLKKLKVHSQVWPYMQKMLDEAKRSNVTIYIASAYRSFNEQEALKQEYKVVYGAGTANQFSADQGYSEHQLGTTVDLTTTGLGGQLDGFDNTKAYEWLAANAHKYGFVLSYPKGNQFYVYEPWHWRFVGIKLATDLHSKNKNFYDLDQRDIDEYLVSIFD